jgi:hypothetical protein
LNITAAIYNRNIEILRSLQMLNWENEKLPYAVKLKEPSLVDVSYSSFEARLCWQSHHLTAAFGSG